MTSVAQRSSRTPGGPGYPPPKRVLSRDIIALACITAVFWAITFIWVAAGLGHLLENANPPESTVWFLALSGLIFVLLIFAFILLWWPVILAVISSLLAVNLVLWRQSAKTRWLCASAVAALVFPVAAQLSPGGFDKLSVPKKMVGFVSTAVFDDNGRITKQSNIVRCQYVDMTSDGRAVIPYQPEIDGDRHWVKRPDGSIIIFAELHPCMNNAALHDREDVKIGSDPAMSRSNETYVFDSSVAPTKVDVLTGNAFTEPNARKLVLKSVSIVRTDAPQATHRLALAFPGMAKMVPDPKQDSLGADIVPGSFIGLRAEATQLAANTNCGIAATSGIYFLPSNDSCVFINDCDKSSSNIVCGKRAGGMQVTYDATFSTARIVPGTPDKNFKATVFHAALPAFDKAPSIDWNGGRRWMPQICMEELCTTLSKENSSVVFYYPAKQLLIEVRSTQQIFGKGAFDGPRRLE